LPTPPDNSRGNIPTNPANKEAEAQDFPRQAGIGAALRIEDGKVLVSKVLPDSPAARSQLIKANDQVIAVAEGNKQPIDVRGTKDLARIVGMIRGPIRTVVRLTIVPEGKGVTDQLVVILIRGDIKEINSFVDGRLLPLGTKAPNFKFARLGNAEESNLSQLAGRIVVVEFWASWCGPCIKTIDEMASLQEQHPEWTGQVELLAVSVDERKEDAVTLLKSKHWSKISIVWAGPDVLKLYCVAGLPTMFVIDRAGSVAAVDHRLDVPAVIKPLLLQSAKKTDSR
jgi:thiol-disulfide isomerase/thioredoxin